MSSASPDHRFVFISYARKDGADHAAQLERDLETHHIDAWRDTRDLDPFTDFSGEIEAAIKRATHVAVCVTPDVSREDSFVRREIAFALAQQKPIIPLVFPGAICPPITIITHTYIWFDDWAAGLAELLERIERGVEETTPETQRERELAYLQTIGQRYDHWRDLYTDMAATARIEKANVRVKTGAAARYLDMQHDIFRDVESGQQDDHAKTITVQSFDELREGIRQHRRAALIGDPGAGKTTTLERLAYELATEAAEAMSSDSNSDKPLPVFVRLDAYEGGDFGQFISASFGGLRLDSYLPERVFLLLDGLNEMPAAHVSQVDGWLRRHPDTPAIVTCRKLDYVGHKLPLQRIDVAPLDVARIRLFVGNYLEDDDCERLFWGVSGAPTLVAWQWFQQKAGNKTFEDFWFGEELSGSNWEPGHKHLKAVRSALREQGKLPGLLGVVSNPFLLFVTVQIYARTGTLPPNQSRLFGDFVALLLEQRGKPAAITRPPWIDEDVQRRALAALAYRMQADRTGTSVERAWALDVIREAVPGQDAEQLLYLAASASILETGQTVRFVHQLLQEYFAAFEMEKDLKRGVPATHYWPGDRWWEQTGWEETALLLAGMLGDADDIVRWLTPVHPTLAYRCATESGADCCADALQPLYDPAVPPIPAYENGDEVDRWRANLPRTTPLARAAWGRILTERGDPRPGVELHANGVPDIEWVEIPTGEFIYQDGKLLTLPTFHIARYPVTYLQFQAFLDAPDGFERGEWWAGLTKEYQKQEMADQYFKFHNHPRDSVSWYQAVAFCRWLSAKLGTEIRLPTEQEWEKAARGTDGRQFPWGDEYVPGYANIDETDPSAVVGPYWLRQTTAIGMYLPGASPYGVLDMSGNVWEWCLNEYSNPENTGLGGYLSRVVRGGSWNYYQHWARAAIRDCWDPFDWNLDLGFRVCGVARPMK